MQVTSIKGVAFLSLLLSFIGCGNKVNENFLGSAVIEATTFQVATTAQGSIVAIYKQEGQQVTGGELLALIDTIPTVLRKQELEANISQLDATISSQQFQVQSGRSDLAGIQREFRRTSELVQKGSLPERDRDNLQTQVESAKFKIDALQKMFQSLTSQKKSLQVRITQFENQIKDCYVHSPSNGIVLTRYRNNGEIVGPGNPIYEIGKNDTLYADFFVPQPVLASLKYEQTVRIRIDYSDPSDKVKDKFTNANITWIGNEAEFSPKNIQTRESRNELVFRVRATIPNKDGILKRGLPVEVWR